ncbi:hypothetical protein BDW69DRAFT_170646 [Aspergillus filifer]
MVRGFRPEGYMSNHSSTLIAKQDLELLPLALEKGGSVSEPRPVKGSEPAEMLFPLIMWQQLYLAGMGGAVLRTTNLDHRPFGGGPRSSCPPELQLHVEVPSLDQHFEILTFQWLMGLSVEASSLSYSDILAIHDSLKADGWLCRYTTLYNTVTCCVLNFGTSCRHIELKGTRVLPRILEHCTV